jgi:hypothetical protein
MLAEPTDGFALSGATPLAASSFPDESRLAHTAAGDARNPLLTSRDEPPGTLRGPGPFVERTRRAGSGVLR